MVIKMTTDSFTFAAVRRHIEQKPNNPASRHIVAEELEVKPKV